MHKDNNTILYLTYDGLTDPLGQSQILPYLTGLARKGYRFIVISFEKRQNFAQHKAQVEKLIQGLPIRWHYYPYTKKPAVLTTWRNLGKMYRQARYYCRKEPVALVHCRSYLAALIGLKLKQKTGVRFLFDMRGFWVDERVEGDIWNLKNPIYRYIYHYFKRKEQAFFENADYTISLTERGKAIIRGWKHLANQPIPIEVIPCCVDTTHFDREQIDPAEQARFREMLAIKDGDFVLGYLGSVGTWYKLKEMLRFFKILLRAKPQAKFLWITPHAREQIIHCARKVQVPESNLLIQAVPYKLVPTLLSLVDIAVFFYKQSFSRSATSPTKQGEILSMGIPLILNAGIGDCDDLLNNGKAGHLIPSFTEEAYQDAVDKLPELLDKDPQSMRKVAEAHFSLHDGIARYDRVYSKLLA